MVATLSQPIAAHGGQQAEAKRALVAQGVSFTEEAFFHSIQAGQDHTVELFLKAGVNVRAKDPEPSSDGWQPIHLAAHLGNLEVVKLLLRHGAQIDEPAPGRRVGLTPLLLAGSSAVAKYLIERGADVNRAGPHTGFTALHRAAASGDVELIELLLRKGAPINVASKIGQMPLEFALMGLKTDAAALLIKKGADISLERGGSALAMAARYGDKKIVSMLIERGVSVNQKEPNSNLGWTPLHWAARNRHTDIVKLLIAKGSDVNALSNTKETPILVAAWSGSTEIVALLLQSGANINARGMTGQTALYNALDTGARDTALLLLQHGAAIDVVTNEGQTPLMAAARHGVDDVVKLLLEKGANTDVRNNNGKTAYDLAVAHQRPGTAAVLSAATRQMRRP
jgi:ankyrin repeat protein